MRDKNNPLLDAPIPGQSLTTEPGNRPWENPPQHATVEGAIQFYMQRFSDKEMNMRLLDILEDTRIPITVLVDVMMQGGVMQGVHNIDVGVLISPVIVEFIRNLAEQAEIDYVLGTETEDAPHPELLRSAIKELPEDMEAIEDLFEASMQPTEEPEEKPAMGIMQRPSKEETE